MSLKLLLVMVIITCATEYMAKGNSCYNDGKFKDAIVAYKKGLNNFENPSLAWYNMGNAWYRLNNLSKAVVCYESSLLEAPDFFIAWLNLGILYQDMDDYGSCISALDRALLLKPNNVQVLSVLAVAHKKLENYNQAVVYLERVLEIDSSMSEAYLMLYEMAYYIGDYNEAQKWLSSYPKTGERAYEVMLLSGDILHEQGDLSGAMYKFRQCTKSWPQKTQAWYKLVLLLSEMDASYEAIARAEESLENGNRSISLTLLAGSISFNKGYYRKAEKFYRYAYSEGHSEGLVGLKNIMTMYESIHDDVAVRRIQNSLKNYDF